MTKAHKLTRKEQRDLRFCKSLSHRQLKRNSKCTTLMQVQHAKDTTKHRRSTRQEVTKHHKSKRR